MSEIFSTVKVMVLVSGGLLFAFLVLLSMPKSRLRQIVLPILGWGLAAASIGYVIMPVDALPEALMGPFGLFDDAGALMLAIGSAVTAVKARHEAA